MNEIRLPHSFDSLGCLFTKIVVVLNLQNTSASSNQQLNFFCKNSAYIQHYTSLFFNDLNFLWMTFPKQERKKYSKLFQVTPIMQIVGTGDRSNAIMSRGKMF